MLTNCPLEKTNGTITPSPPVHFLFTGSGIDKAMKKANELAMDIDPEAFKKEKDVEKLAEMNKESNSSTAITLQTINVNIVNQAI